MAIVITGDLDWTGALVLFLEALDGGPAADIAGYAFTSSGDLEYSCSVPEPVLPADRLLGTYRCVAETAGGVIAGVGYCSIAAATTAVRMRSEEASALGSASLSAVKAQVVDALSVDTYAELSAPPAALSSLKDKITWLFMYARNKVTQTASQRKLYRDDGTTVAGTSATSDVSGTFTKGEDA